MIYLTDHQDGSMDPMPTPLETLRKFVPRGNPDECWEWTGFRQDGGRGEYGLMKADGVTKRAHRVAFELAYGPIPIGMEICHSCDNPPCCNPGHLSIGTRRDNMGDSIAKGRTSRGENHSNLTNFDIRYIRTMYAVGVATQAELAQDHDISRRAVNKIVNRVTWKHI